MNTFGVTPYENLNFQFGNKIKNIVELKNAGIRVPNGFGLSYQIYDEFVDSIKEKLSIILQNSLNYYEMESKIHELFTSTSFCRIKEVMSAIDKYIPNAKYFAVRSSGAPVVSGQRIAEDSAGVSLAGQYESFLFVPKDKICDAILSCYASLFSNRCLRQFNVIDDSSYVDSSMSVLIQEMYPADFSAIVMTRDPVEGEEHFGIEMTFGACEALVSGKTQGDLYILKRETGEVVEKQLGSKNTYITYRPFSKYNDDNKITLQLEKEKKCNYAASISLINQIFELSMQIEKHFKCPQDIELVVINGEIVVVQTRPITACA